MINLYNSILIFSYDMNPTREPKIETPTYASVLFYCYLAMCLSIHYSLFMGIIFF
jgi:hypothetical protein